MGKENLTFRMWFSEYALELEVNSSSSCCYATNVLSLSIPRVETDFVNRRKYSITKYKILETASFFNEKENSLLPGDTTVQLL